MTSLRCNNFEVRVFISKNEKITVDKAKELIVKARRMIAQNKANSVIIEFENTPRVNRSASEFFNRVLCIDSNFPVAIIGG